MIYGEVSIDIPFLKTKLRIHRKFIRQLFLSSKKKFLELLKKAKKSEFDILFRIISLVVNHVIPISGKDGLKIKKLKNYEEIKRFQGTNFFNKTLKQTVENKKKILLKFASFLKIFLKPICKK